MNKRNRMLLIFTLLYISVAHAGQEGHGGEVIICPGKATVVYDVYEAAMRHMKVDLGPQNLLPLEKVALALARYGQRDPVNAKFLQSFLSSFYVESKFDDFSLLPIDDGKQVAIPNGCELGQLADQRLPRFPEDKRYLIANKYWRQLDNDQKAVAILHEIIYRRAIEIGQTDSRRTRYLNSYIFSGKITTISNLEYYRVMNQTNFFAFYGGFITLNQLTFKYDESEPVRFFADGKISSGYLIDQTPITIGSQKLWARARIEFFENGSVKEMVLSQQSDQSFYYNGTTFPLSYNPMIYDRSHPLPDLEFDLQGHLLTLYLGGITTIPYLAQGQKVDLIENAFSLQLYPNGDLRSGCIVGHHLFQGSGGALLPVNGKDSRNCARVSFLLDGRLETWPH